MEQEQPYQFGKGKRTPTQRRKLRKYYRQNKSKMKREQRKRYNRYGPEKLDRPGGVTRKKRKQRRPRKYPESIKQPRRSSPWDIWLIDHPTDDCCNKVATDFLLHCTVLSEIRRVARLLSTGEFL